MSKPKAFSFLKGYSFTFDDEGRNIEAWFSSLSGSEKVFVDGTLVSSTRNITTRSSNNFQIGEDSYNTSLKMVSIFKGPVVCTLSKNGEEIKRQKLVYPPHKYDLKKPAYWFELLIYLAAFSLISVGVFVFALNYWQLSVKSSLNLLFFVVMISSLSYLAYFFWKWAAEIEIVDEEIG